MYKRLSLQEISGLQTQFFTRLHSIYKSERCQMLKEYLRVAFKEGNDVYYFREGNPYFRLSKRDDGVVIFADESEKIELQATEEDIQQLHNIMKAEKTLTKAIKSNRSIKEILVSEFDEGLWSLIGDKPYIVYDIETENITSNNIATHKFTIAYAFLSQDRKYKLITKENMKKFADFLLDFDGYIIGFNHIGYDNPVLMYNAGYSVDEIQKLDDKSIDIFLFVYHLLKRRMSLNKLGDALIGIKKTLESGMAGEKLRRDYIDKGDEKAFTEYKKYCKNDVTMTHLLLLYLLRYKKLSDEGDDITFDEQTFLSLSKAKSDEIVAVNNVQQSIFS